MITGEEYRKGLVLFRFLAYYAIPLCIIAGFYLGMARHLELSTRNIPGELPGAPHQSGQIRARKKVNSKLMKEMFKVIEFLDDSNILYHSRESRWSATLTPIHRLIVE